MSLFISHAKADQELVRAFVGLLENGCCVPKESIFCTSLEGMGIPLGENSNNYIQSKIDSAVCVIFVITPSFQESPFCQNEIGASWVLKKKIFPLIVPPLSYPNLKAVLSGTQAGHINDASKLDELYKYLLGEKIGSDSDDWDKEKANFLSQLDKISQMFTQTTDETVKVIKKDEVREVSKKYSSYSEQFDCLIQELKDAIDEVGCSVLTEVLYYQTRYGYYDARKSSKKAFEEAINKDFLVYEGDNMITVSWKRPKTEKVLEKLEELKDFMRGDKTEDFRKFEESFEEEHDVPFDIENQEFWEEFLGLKI